MISTIHIPSDHAPTRTLQVADTPDGVAIDIHQPPAPPQRLDLPAEVAQALALAIVRLYYGSRQDNPAKAPERMWCWNYQATLDAWGAGWGGYARPNHRHPLSERERDTGAEYVRADLYATLEAERDRFEAALARACLVGGTTYLIERAEKAELALADMLRQRDPAKSEQPE